MNYIANYMYIEIPLINTGNLGFQVNEINNYAYNAHEFFFKKIM